MKTTTDLDIIADLDPEFGSSFLGLGVTNVGFEVLMERFTMEGIMFYII